MQEALIGALWERYIDALSSLAKVRVRLRHSFLLEATRHEGAERLALVGEFLATTRLMERLKSLTPEGGHGAYKECRKDMDQLEHSLTALLELVQSPCRPKQVQEEDLLLRTRDNSTLLAIEAKQCVDGAAVLDTDSDRVDMSSLR
ncbi:MAG: hypothetical protein GWN58_31815 [Anaerolineae bacterium]|nr:hypothetical protein [Anaerolineae bacterium]